MVGSFEDRYKFVSVQLVIDFVPVVILVPREKSPHIISNKKANELECLAQLGI